MKITIDTKEDSKDEIKKVISLLKNMLDEPVSNVNIFEDKIEPKEGMFNILNKTEPTVEDKDIKTDDLLKESNTIIEEKEDKKFKIESY